MNTLSSFPTKPVAVVVFLAALVIGWNLTSPLPPSSVAEESPSESVMKHGTRPARSSSAAVTAAGKHMAAIRAVADPEARLLATISLANSLSPEDFAAWKDGGLFDLRGGSELMIFSKILMDRWQAEDPDGLLAWAEKNQNGAADGLMQEWAAKDPQRLLDYFKTHRNDRKELEMLGHLAAKSPDLAIQRLKEMTAAGVPPDAMGSASGLMAVLAEKSPAGLAALLDSLLGEMRLEAEGALGSRLLKASFSDGIQYLAARPDGWKILSEHVDITNEMTSKLIDELPNLPLEWIRGIASNPWQIVTESTAQKWWDTDLQAAGFSPGEIKMIRAGALTQLAGRDPEGAIRRLGEEEFNSNQRRNVLASTFNHGEPEKLRPLLEQLTNEEERKIATQILDRRSAPAVEFAKVNSPDELWSKVDSAAAAASYLSQTRDWDAGKIAALTAGFKGLPDDRKALIAQTITAEYSGFPPPLQGEAMRYLVANPGLAKNITNDGYSSLTAQSSRYAANLLVKDPVAASSWVESLPAGENKAWAQKNLISNWQQYDPKAAAAWEKGLPASERATIQKLSVPTP